MPLPPGAYTVTFSGGGLVAPSIRTVTVGGGNAKLDLDTQAPDPTASYIQFASTVASIQEGDTINLIVQRTGDLSQSAGVQIVTGPGSSVSPTDYNLLDGALVSFAPGQQTATLRLHAQSDGIAEGIETLVLVINPQEGLRVGANGRVTVMIAASDQAAPEPAQVLRATAVGSSQGIRTIALQLGGDVDPKSVTKAGAYLVRRAGRDRLLNTRDDPRVAVSRVVFNRTTKVATLFLSTALKAGEIVSLGIRANTLRNIAGVVLASTILIDVSPAAELRRRG
jgi:hypothetical protein